MLSLIGFKVNRKYNLVLVHAIKAEGGVHINRYSFVRSAVISELSASRPGRFSAVKDPVIPTEQEAVWAPKHVWTLLSEEPLSLPEIESRSFSSPVSSLIITPSEPCPILNWNNEIQISKSFFCRI
jgi:hypothetical protein